MQDMMLSNLHPTSATKEHDIPAATSVTRIIDLVNLINGTSKRRMKVIGFATPISPRVLAEYTDIGADMEDGLFYVFDNASSALSVTLGVDSIKSYHENDVSISIYFDDGGLIVLRAAS